MLTFELTFTYHSIKQLKPADLEKFSGPWAFFFVLQKYNNLSTDCCEDYFTIDTRVIMEKMKWVLENKQPLPFKDIPSKGKFRFRFWFRFIFIFSFLPDLPEPSAQPYATDKDKEDQLSSDDNESLLKTDRPMRTKSNSEKSANGEEMPSEKEENSEKSSKMSWEESPESSDEVFSSEKSWEKSSSEKSQKQSNFGSNALILVFIFL